MASKSYAFDYDTKTRLLKLKLNGLWDDAVLRAFSGEARSLRDSVGRAGHRSDDGRILIDLTDYLVQPKSITEGIAKLLPTFGDRAGRVAILRSASALQHLQMKRLISSDKVRSFDDRGEALAWLGE